MWKQTESNVRPMAVDVTSSKKYNYDFRNVTEEKRTGENDEEYTVYVYEENAVPKSDWDNYLALKELKAKQEASDQALQDMILLVAGGEENV